MSSFLKMAAGDGILKRVLGRKGRRVYIDNVYFRMHYVWTLTILLSGATLITSKIIIGDPITCMGNEDIMDFAKQYCYIHSTLTLGRLDKGNWVYEPAKETQIYPGIRPSHPNEPVIIHGYYQWVGLVLLLQAASFYFPHWAWKKLERGTVMMLLGTLNLPMTPEPEKAAQRQRILDYLRRNRGHHQKYAKFHIITEAIGLINLLLQMWICNRLLDNAFLTYGPAQLLGLLQQKPFERTDKLSRLFPTVTSCRLYTGGVAFGRVQHDVLCILPLNMLNEKIYIVIWFWFLTLLVATLIGGIYRILTFSLSFRIYMISRRLRRDVGDRSRACAESFCRKELYGEWFLLYKLSQNMDTVTFGDLIIDVDDDYQVLNNNLGATNSKLIVSVEQVDAAAVKEEAL